MLIQGQIPRKHKIVRHSENYTMLLADTGTLHTATGGVVRLRLPVGAPIGIEYYFTVTEQYQLNIDPQATQKLLAGNDTQDDKYYSANAIGASMHVCSDENGDWMVVSKSETWTREA